MTFDRDIAVIVPDPDGLGVVVCSISDLAEKLATPDTSFDDVLADAGFDATLRDRDVPDLVARVRALNRTGDVAAYWNTDQTLAAEPAPTHVAAGDDEIVHEEDPSFYVDEQVEPG